MKKLLSSPLLRSLIIGDAVVLTLLTIYGFLDHQTLASAGTRFWITLIGTWTAWLLASPWFDLYDEKIVSDWKQLWRIAYAAALAVPLAVIVRALLLDRQADPIFGIVLIAFSALGLMVWRGVYGWWRGRK